MASFRTVAHRGTIPGMRPPRFCSAHLPGVVAALALLVAPAQLLAQKSLAEPRAGLEFKPPKSWVELPADGDRHATVRLYAAPRALAGKAEGTHTPLLRVMFFAKGGDASGDLVDGLPRQTPFRDLEDFARRGLGATDVAKEAHKVGAIEGQRLGGKGIAGDLVLLGQTVPLDDGEAALCFEVLANQAEKLKKDFEGTFASVDTMARAPSPRPAPPWLAAADWAKLDAAARAAARRKWAEELVAATSKAPEAGFKVGKSKYWTVLSAADPGFTKKAIAAAETARTWCAQKLPDLTKDAPLPAILRIFDSMEHYQAFLTTDLDQREYHARRRELLFVNDRDNGGSSGYGMLFRAVLWQVFDDVDPGVLPALPRWLDNGCWEFMRSTRCDGKKIEFMPSDVERGRIEYQQRAKSMPALWDLMQEHIQVSPEGGANETAWGYTPECARLMRWFWIDDGQKAFARPTLVSDYVRALGAAYQKLGPDPTADAATLGLTEAQQKDVNTRHYKWRDAMLVGANDIAVPLQVDAWKAINEKWLDYNKNYK